MSNLQNSEHQLRPPTSNSISLKDSRLHHVEQKFSMLAFSIGVANLCVMVNVQIRWEYSLFIYFFFLFWEYSLLMPQFCLSNVLILANFFGKHLFGKTLVRDKEDTSTKQVKQLLSDWLEIFSIHLRVQHGEACTITLYQRTRQLKFSAPEAFKYLPTYFAGTNR